MQLQQPQSNKTSRNNKYKSNSNKMLRLVCKNNNNRNKKTLINRWMKKINRMKVKNMTWKTNKRLLKRMMLKIFKIWILMGRL
jgi:hypothetical protein